MYMLKLINSLCHQINFKIKFCFKALSDHLLKIFLNWLPLKKHALMALYQMDVWNQSNRCGVPGYCNKF